MILGTQWQQESQAVRNKYKAQAAQLKEEHKQKHPTYQYQPRKSTELKRRMTKKKAAALIRAQDTSDSAMLANVDDTAPLNSVVQDEDLISAWAGRVYFGTTPDKKYNSSWARVQAEQEANDQAFNIVWRQYINPT